MTARQFCMRQRRSSPDVPITGSVETPAGGGVAFPTTPQVPSLWRTGRDPYETPLRDTKDGFAPLTLA